MTGNVGDDNRSLGHQSPLCAAPNFEASNSSRNNEIPCGDNNSKGFAAFTGTASKFGATGPTSRHEQLYHLSAPRSSSFSPTSERCSQQLGSEFSNHSEMGSGRATVSNSVSFMAVYALSLLAISINKRFGVIVLPSFLFRGSQFRWCLSLLGERRVQSK